MPASLKDNRSLTLRVDPESLHSQSRRSSDRVDLTEFRIGELATRAGVSIDTVRYYERLKLLPRAGRTAGGFRLFGPESVERVQFIKPGARVRSDAGRDQRTSGYGRC